jgi:hypothetical protein
MQIVTSTGIIDGVYLEEVPSQTFGVDYVTVINPGYNYSTTPTVTIAGDGQGANAYAVIAGGSIKNIVVSNSGNNYTSAIATITPAEGDTTGAGGVAVVTLQGQYGTMRSYYFNSNNVKTILNDNVGTIDYVNGIIKLNNFSPYQVDNLLGQISLTATPQNSIISSVYDGIITIDPYDPTAITVNVIAKTNQ